LQEFFTKHKFDFSAAKKTNIPLLISTEY